MLIYHISLIAWFKKLAGRGIRDAQVCVSRVGWKNTPSMHYIYLVCMYIYIYIYVYIYICMYIYIYVYIYMYIYIYRYVHYKTSYCIFIHVCHIA